MTQKELSYLEDAIGHEDNIIKICDLTVQNLENQELVTFIEEEKNTHQALKENLLNLLEEKNNE